MKTILFFRKNKIHCFEIVKQPTTHTPHLVEGFLNGNKNAMR